MSRRHAVRRRQRGEELDRNRRARILGADSRRMRLVAAHVSALRPQRPLYRMKAKAMGRRFTSVVVRLTADVRGLVGACMRASAAVNRFGEAARAWERESTRLRFLAADARVAVAAVQARGGRPSTYRYVSDRLAQGLTLQRALEYLDAGVPGEVVEAWESLR
jgi:hypothetical protein